MIRSFRHKGLKRLYEEDDARGIFREHLMKVKDILARLDLAQTEREMDVPGFHLHPLRGDLASTWAVTVRANWRITFRFQQPDAFDVDYVDYH